MLLLHGTNFTKIPSLFLFMNLELLTLFYPNLKLMSNSQLGMRSMNHSQRDAIFILSDNDARKVNRLQES